MQWLYVDLNSYFASVEQQLNPQLRGKPVAVVPMLADTTCCIAASYEAKKFGIKTGTLVKEAKKLCPDIVLIAGRHEHYVEYHEKIVAAVETCVPITAVLSIDEMACRLLKNEQEHAVELAKKIKQTILQVGSQLRCSIGIAPNRFLAKVASDMKKPDGLVTIKQEDLPKVLFPLKLRDFPGIGPRMERRLYRHNIFTTEQLVQLKMEEMAKIWGGIGGEYFFRWLHGENLILKSEKNKSIGHSHILPPHLRNPQGAYAVAQKLLQKTAIRLRKINCWTRCMALSIRYVNKQYWADDMHTLECQDTTTLLEILRLLWQRRPPGNPMKVSITLFDFISDEERSFSFFENEKRVRLSQHIDKINAKFGKNTVYFAGIHHIQAAAPTRIAFSSIPDLAV